MGKAGEPAIKEQPVSKDYTCIAFYPDLKKFKMESLDRDTVSLLTRRAYDIAASVRGITVYLNGQKLKVHDTKHKYLASSLLRKRIHLAILLGLK